MPPEFAVGARNAVRACLDIGPQDHVCIIRDRPRRHIAEAIEEEALTTGATVRAWTMEDHVSRPATSFPRSIADEILRFGPTASYFIGIAQKGELAFREPMVELLTHELRSRHVVIRL
jgi:aminopeptidase